MKTTRSITRILGIAVFLCCILASQVLGAEKAKIALLSVDNGGKDPRYDYLEGLLGGLMLYDLSNAEGITIVERASLESILREQELRISDMADAKAFEIGKVLGADYLLKASFVFMGDDVVLNGTVMDVATSKTFVFSDRGRTENLAHRICEKIIKKLTGRDVTLASDQHERSILSLKDEKPGSISLHTPIIEAEIYLDEEFVSYTTGDEKVPSKMENVIPGRHTLRIHLGGFGVFKQPELTFADWKEAVDVLPGKNHVIRARPRYLPELVHEARRLMSDTDGVKLKDGKGTISKTIDTGFTDRNGEKVPGTVNLSLACADKKAQLDIMVQYGSIKKQFSITCAYGEEKDVNETIEKVDYSFELDFKIESRPSITYRAFRNDVTLDEFKK